MFCGILAHAAASLSWSEFTAELQSYRIAGARADYGRVFGLRAFLRGAAPNIIPNIISGIRPLRAIDKSDPDHFALRNNRVKGFDTDTVDFAGPAMNADVFFAGSLTVGETPGSGGLTAATIAPAVSLL